MKPSRYVHASAIARRVITAIMRSHAVRIAIQKAHARPVRNTP